MNIYEFMSDSPWLSFFLACIIIQTCLSITNRFFRMINIWKHGYPPLNCDADGDFKKEDKD